MPSKKSCAGMTRSAAALALGHHLGVERGRHRAPFGGRIGVRDAAAERAAGADRMMRDVAHHRGEQAAERAVLHRLLERRMAHAGADAELAVLDLEAVELGDAVDVDQMLRPRQPERHGRHQALPAGQHAAVVVGVFAPAGPASRRWFSGRGTGTGRASFGPGCPRCVALPIRPSIGRAGSASTLRRQP